MSKENTTVSLQVHSDYVETRKRETDCKQGTSVQFLICTTVANACNIHVYHFDITFHILCL